VAWRASARACLAHLGAAVLGAGRGRGRGAAPAGRGAAGGGAAGPPRLGGGGGARLPRRYFAFLALAERRPSDAWPLFRTYLRTPAAHHAFVAGAVEAARHYPGRSVELVALLARIRGDQLLLRLLSPQLLHALDE